MGWLVLSRKKSERIKIGDDIEIMVSDIRGSIVGIAINAPRSLHVRRLPPRDEEVVVEPNREDVEQ